MSTWDTVEPTEVTAGLIGLTLPNRELYAEIEKRGWTVQNVAFKGKQYVAKGKSQIGHTVEANGPTDDTALGNLLMAIMRKEFVKPTPRTAAWHEHYTKPGMLQSLAEAYANAPVYDPKAAPAWKELAEDSRRRADEVRKQIRVEVTDHPEPYANAHEMQEDIHKNRHFSVSRANSDHPIWSPEDNVNFRIVHDVLGHAPAGGNFDWTGETQACGMHLPLLSESAQKALATECLGQTAYAAHYRDFGPQKICFLPDHIEPYQAIENKPGHQGVHPSQSIVGTSGPEIPAPDYEGFGALPKGTIAPHHEDAIKSGPGYSPSYPGSSGFTSFGAQKEAGAPVDPNYKWDSGVDPLPNNAYMWQTNPLTGQPPLDIDTTKDMASRLQTDWHGQDYDTAKQAVMNAVRAALLSPKKDLRWNAVNYQDISHIAPTVEDPKRYWDALTVARERWNGARGHEQRSHKKWYENYVKFKQMLKATLHKTDEEIHDIAERELMNMTMEEHERISIANPKLDAYQLEGHVDKALDARLKVMTKEKHTPELDHGQMQMFASEEQLSLPLDLQPINPAKYGGVMPTSVKYLAAASKHADELTKAALEDVREHNGTGHHFRAAMLSMGVKGVGAKVASFAWLLLQPMTSQLGTIDSHMAKYLGTDPEKFSKRDYFRAERQLQAGRDAAGYGHVPLGQFQWAMWDSKRTGTPQDHSAFRVLNPVSHHDVQWQPSLPPMEEEPNWWLDTAPARAHVGKQFDEVLGPQFKNDKIPFQRSSAKAQIPYFVNSEGEQVHGHAGQSIMNHMKNQFQLSTQDIWALPHEVGKQ